MRAGEHHAVVGHRARGEADGDGDALNATAVIVAERESVDSARTAKTRVAATHMSAGFFVGGAACLDSAVSCAGFLSVLVAGRPMS
jgi:hypothetical protein